MVVAELQFLAPVAMDVILFTEKGKGRSLKKKVQPLDLLQKMFAFSLLMCCGWNFYKFK